MSLRVLHLTAHMGGGVGRVLSRVTAQAQRTTGWRHEIACLEKPEKTVFVTNARCGGVEVVVQPERQVVRRKIRDADIVLVHWWHHPAMAQVLGNLHTLGPMRLAIWSHVSGLTTPCIEPGFVAAPHRFIFTSHCSLDNPLLSNLDPEWMARQTAVVYSSGGFDDLICPPRQPREEFVVGYLGTLNPCKLHPEYLDFYAAASAGPVRFETAGDLPPPAPSRTSAAMNALLSRIEHLGYVDDPAAALARFDVFGYLLNPQHYGTTENALLEAMALGVPPIVLDNPAERCLVEHGETGLVVRTPGEFAAAVEELRRDSTLRRRLGNKARRTVRERFAIERTAKDLHTALEPVAAEDPREFDLREVFGAKPRDWFLSCLGQWRSVYLNANGARSRRPLPRILHEASKGSVYQYHSYFPRDAGLRRWARLQMEGRL
ncbi:MAG: hypothetical protein Kow006_24290 [Gammaproteobacteria bacterium]